MYNLTNQNPISDGVKTWLKEMLKGALQFSFEIFGIAISDFLLKLQFCECVEMKVLG